MTENEARTEAEKRERHKSKHMTHKRWSAQHDSVKGWHVALIDTPNAIAAPATLAERGLTLPAMAVCVALFGPTATMEALAALARRDDIPCGGIVPPSTGRVKLVSETSPEFIIPRKEKS
jgi:hypothetical protein